MPEENITLAPTDTPRARYISACSQFIWDLSFRIDMDSSESRLPKFPTNPFPPLVLIIDQTESARLFHFQFCIFLNRIVRRFSIPFSHPVTVLLNDPSQTGPSENVLLSPRHFNSVADFLHEQLTTHYAPSQRVIPLLDIVRTLQLFIKQKVIRQRSVIIHLPTSHEGLLPLDQLSETATFLASLLNTHAHFMIVQSTAAIASCVGHLTSQLSCFQRSIRKQFHFIPMTTQAFSRDRLISLNETFYAEWIASIPASREVSGYFVEIDPQYVASDACFDMDQSPQRFTLRPARLKVDTLPFDKGSYRLAFRGTNVMTEQPIVAKVFATPYASAFHQFLDVLEMNVITERLAWEFNQTQSDDHRRVTFVPCRLFVEAPVGGNEPLSLTYDELEEMDGASMMFVEPELRGRFVKFNNIHGETNMTRYSATVNAFSHWTFVRTGQQLMVVDLQGIADPQRAEYLLTDPALHHESLSKFFFSFTSDNRQGMELFFHEHQCNATCKTLGLDALSLVPRLNTRLKTVDFVHLIY